jgi:hypothetical protein
MRLIFVTLVAPSVFAAIAPANAGPDAKSFFDQQQRQSGGGM